MTRLLSFTLLLLLVFTLSATAQDWVGHPIVEDRDRHWDMDLADIDGDGDLDIVSVVLDYGDQDFRLLWLENVMPYGFFSHVIDQGYAYTQVDVADLDNDGDPDLVATGTNTDFPIRLATFTNEDQGVSWQITEIVSGSDVPWVVGVGDLDRDGLPDIAGLHYAFEPVRLYLNGAWDQPVQVDQVFVNPASLITADALNTGFAQAYFCGGETGSSYTSLLHYTADGSLEVDTVDLTSKSHELFAGDQDGDGIDELYGNSQEIPFLYRWIYDGAWTRTTLPVSTPAIMHDVRVADVNGDDVNDFAVAVPYGVFTVVADGDGFVSTEISGTVDSYRNVHAVDFDQDGDLDLLTIRYLPWAIHLWEQRADGEMLPVDIQLTLDDPGAEVDPGDDLLWTFDLTSNLLQGHPAVIWTAATTPAHALLQPLLSQPIQLTPGLELTVPVTQVVPANAPPGTYWLSVHVGQTVGNPVFSDVVSVKVAD